jgi:hypothetical protein
LATPASGSWTYRQPFDQHAGGWLGVVVYHHQFQLGRINPLLGQDGGGGLHQRAWPPLRRNDNADPRRHEIGLHH